MQPDMDDIWVDFNCDSTRALSQYAQSSRVTTIELLGHSAGFTKRWHVGRRHRPSVYPGPHTTRAPA